MISVPRTHAPRLNLRPLAFALRHSLLLGAFLALTPTAIAHAQSQADTAQVQQMDIPAGPLGAALSQFAARNRVVISFDASLTEGLSTEGLSGRYGVAEGLHVLLAGSGLQAVLDRDGSYRIVSAEHGALPAMQVSAAALEEGARVPGITVYGAEHIATAPGRNGQITELLRQHPAVQFDRYSRDSKTPADLSAENISINGAKYWDNNFSVDGINVNNDINPGGRTVAANSSFTDLPANTSQGMNLDTSLLEAITVYDSNVPARFGGFTGGVIDATTRDPSQRLAGSISASMTKDSWTEYHLDERYQDDFYDSGDADGTAEIQPDFKTLTYRATLEGHLTDDFGLLGSVVRRQSTIYDKNIYARTYADNGVTAPTVTDLQQQIDNLFLKAVWAASDRLDLSASLNYAPQKAEYFNINTLNGGFDMESGGLQFNVKADWRGNWGTWRNALYYTEVEQSRQNGADYFKAWYASDEKNWSDPTQRWNAAMEGTYGNIEQSQEKLGHELRLELLPFAAGGVQHNVSLGSLVEYTEASYVRDNTFIQANGTDLVATYSCLTASGAVDTEYCSALPITANPYRGWEPGAGQMFNRLFYYLPGDIEVDQLSLAAFAEDRMEWRNVELRAGLRAEWDDYQQNANLAPRVSGTWDLFSDGSTRLIAGANRYYGRNIFDFRLREERESLRYYTLRDSTTLEFGELTLAARNATSLQDMDTPYDDELTLAIEQVVADTLFTLRVVSRDGRDQIHREPVTNDGSRPDLATTYYTYTNDGKTDSLNYYLSVSPLRALDFWDTRTHGELTLSWNDVTTTNTGYDEEFDDTPVMYKGKVIKTYDIPVDNYTRPWSARLATTTQIPAWGLTLGNFFNWRADYSQVIRTGRVTHEGQSIYNYEDYDISSALTWDMRVGWEQALGNHQAVFANLDVGNVLNRRNAIGSSSSYSTTAELDYELGRNFTLEVGYRF